MVKEVRGVGLFNAIEFQPPKSFGLRLLYAGFNKAHPGLFGQMIVKTLFEQEKILSQMAGNNFMVIKSLPPLVITEEQIVKYAASLERVCSLVENEKTAFWTQGLKIAAKAFTERNPRFDTSCKNGFANGWRNQSQAELQNRAVGKPVVAQRAKEMETVVAPQ
jgi:hypothetical protein